jgi:radical SAM enzyme (TIGR01210 family)
MGRGAGREDRRIRALRPPKPAVDPWRPIDVLREEERLPQGGVAPTVTVFLAGAECPFTCVFCDLWRFTTDGPTPEGAIPAQLRRALERTGELPPQARIKLYNASNFFDPRAVPPADDPEIARLVAAFDRVVVECHPKLVGRRCREFAERLGGRLQVAMGLETVHPEAASRLNKRSGPDDFRHAAADLALRGIELRAFVLVGAPFVPADETVEWTERSAALAAEQGAVHVSLVPVRGGNGEMERLELSGLFHRPTLEQIEEALERCLRLAPVVTVDAWDLGGPASRRFADCPSCSAARIARLERINRTGDLEPRVACPECERRGRMMR